MKQKIQIAIPEPCNEGWQNMTPVEKGRFCASCQKTVLDFTQLSDNEIIKLVSKNDNLCGRFTTTQLDRNLIETKRTSNYFGYVATSVLAFLGLGTTDIVAQEKPVQEQTNNKYQYKPTDTIQEITVSGVILNNENKPLQSVLIRIQNTNQGVESNEKGEYFIKANLGDILVFSYLGYEDRIATVKSNKLNIFLKDSIESFEIGIIITKKRTFFGRTFRNIGNWFR